MKDEPPIIDELDRGVLVVDRNPVGLRVSAVVALMPSCWSLDVCREIVSGSGYDGSDPSPSGMTNCKLAMVECDV